MVEHSGNTKAPTLEEIELAIKCQKLNKAPDIYDIPAELIKLNGPWIMKTVHNLVLSI